MSHSLPAWLRAKLDRASTPLLVAAVFGVLFGFAFVFAFAFTMQGSPPEQQPVDPLPPRLDSLEQAVARLQARAQVQAILLDAIAHPTGDPAAAPAFSIECEKPWQQMGAIGQALWGCRAPLPAAEGFFPNCNLTASPLGRARNARELYERALSRSPTLRGVRKLAASATRVQGSDAYQASFEHELGGQPLRVLATVVAVPPRAYAITCSAPPETFEDERPRFAAISSSFRLTPGGWR